MLKKLKNNNKGSGWAIIRVSCYMILIVAFMAAVDAVVLMGDMAIISYNMMYATKQLAVEGGLPGGSKNREAVTERMERAAQLAGLNDDDWTLTVYSDGLSGGKADLHPGNSTAEDKNRKAVNGISGDLAISQGFNKIQNIEFKFIYRWKFCPLMWAAQMTTPININFNYRSEYIRPTVRD